MLSIKALSFIFIFISMLLKSFNTCSLLDVENKTNLMKKCSNELNKLNIKLMK